MEKGDEMRKKRYQTEYTSDEKTLGEKIEA